MSVSPRHLLAAAIVSFLLQGELCAQGGVVMITADHGNSEKMRNENGKPHTAHTTNPVPFILVDDTRKNVRLNKGVLGDIAPTILHVMGIPQPEPMTGRTLIDE